MRYQVLYAPRMVEVEAPTLEDAIRQANQELSAAAEQDQLRPKVYEIMDRPRRLEVVGAYALVDA